MHELAGLPAPHPLTTAYTISLGVPAAMAEAAAKAASRALLKVKLGGDNEQGGDAARIAAVRAAAPQATLIVDANEGWNEEDLAANLAACAAAGVALVEQPLPDGRDHALAAIKRPIPVCADESVHDRTSLSALTGKYDAVNIKLDKAGGLTEALAMAEEARRLGFTVMAGCMVATSLAMAPAVLLAQTAALCRSRRAAAARQRPRRRPDLQRQPGFPRLAGTVGLIASRVPGPLIFLNAAVRQVRALNRHGATFDHQRPPARPRPSLPGDRVRHLK